MAKISRNDKCPCGSGKKYKHCCINNFASSQITHSSQFDFIDEKSKFVLEAGGFLNELKLKPELINDPEWWAVLGTTLSQNDDDKSAGSALKKAYKLSNNEPIYLLNIAANLSMQGNPQQALELIKEIPKDTKRRAIITGNILRELGSYEKAIPFYEKAIDEESDFYLAYSNLLTCLTEVNSLSIEYWFEKSIKKFPNEYSILLKYCMYLFATNRLDELYEFGKNLDLTQLSKERDDVISHSDNKLKVNSLNLYIEIGKIHKYMNLDNINNAVNLLGNNCSIAKYLVSTSANIGSISNVEQSYGHICEECKSSEGQFDKQIVGDLNAFKAVAYQVSGEVLKALEAAKKSHESFPSNINALHVAWWTADDLRKNDEAIEYARLLYDAAPKDSPQYETIAHNLAWLYMKDGDLALAKHFYEESIKMKHFQAYEGLAFNRLLSANFDEAEEVWEEYSKKYKFEADFDESLVHFDFAYSVDGEVHISDNKKEISIQPNSISKDGVILNYYLTDNNRTSFSTVTLSFALKDKALPRDNLILHASEKTTISIHEAYIQPSVMFNQKKQKWQELSNFAMKTLGSQSYTLDLISKNTEVDPVIGGVMAKIKKKTFTNEDLISAIQGHDSISKEEVLYQLEMDKRGDLSAILSELKTEIPIWDHLPDEAKNALLEGFKRLSNQNSIDYAPVIVTIVKSLEISLKKLIFDEFSQKCKLDININKYIEIGLQPKFKQAHNFIRFIEKGSYLELGAMNHVFKLTAGKTANKLPLLSLLSEFISKTKKLDLFLSKDTIEDLDYLSSMRNPAAHAKNYNYDDAVKVKKVTVSLFSKLT